MSKGKYRVSRVFRYNRDWGSQGHHTPKGSGRLKLVRSSTTSVNRHCKLVDVFLRISLQYEMKKIEIDFKCILICIIEYFRLAVGTHVPRELRFTANFERMCIN